MATFNGSVKQHHRMAAGERITGMKHGGYVKGANGAAGGAGGKSEYAADEAKTKRVRHDDLAEDKKLISQEFAKRGLRGGGKAKRGC